MGYLNVAGHTGQRAIQHFTGHYHHGWCRYGRSDTVNRNFQNLRKFSW